MQALPQNIPVLATTATANNRVVNDIIEQLSANLRAIRGNLIRESLQLQNIVLGSSAARMAWLAEELPNLPGSGIIYTLTIKEAERLAYWLISQGIDAKTYHSNLENLERQTLEDQLLNSEIKALVATTALGMGFDKPDLGFVIHYQRPGSAATEAETNFERSADAEENPQPQGLLLEIEAAVTDGEVTHSLTSDIALTYSPG